MRPQSFEVAGVGCRDDRATQQVCVGHEEGIYRLQFGEPLIDGSQVPRTRQVGADRLVHG